MSRLLVFLFLPILGYEARVDMSYKYDESTNMWPGGKTLEYNDRSGRKNDGTWYATKDFCMAEHSGTHMDAPFHFNQEGWKLGQIPFDRFFGPGVKVDISERAAKDSDAKLEVADLEKWEEENGEIPEGAIVLVFSGWGKHWNNRTAYFGAPGLDTRQYHFPGVNPSAAEWIVKSGKVVGVGIDSPSIDTGGSAGHSSHVVLSKVNIYNLENVANMDKIPASGAQITALPINLKEGTGGPVRIVAEYGSSAASTNSQVTTLIVGVACVLFNFLL